MTLREKLEAVWNSRRIACPSHRTIWSLTPVGWKFTIHKLFVSYDLWFRPGRLTFYTSYRLFRRKYKTLKDRERTKLFNRK